MNELHLFAGDGGGILGGILSGDAPVCAVEIRRRCRETLLQRQHDGIIPWFPIWDDVRTFDGRPWRGIAQVVSGGFPCTDISSARTNSKANGKQLGIDGASSGLWREMARIIGEVQPEIVRIENSPNLRARGLVQILKDLDGLGYYAKWGVLQCRNLGADHFRKRLFIVASNSNGSQREGGSVSGGIHAEHANTFGANWWQNKPRLERVANGMPAQMERLRAIGNRQVPVVAALAWETLKP